MFSSKVNLRVTRRTFLCDESPLPFFMAELSALNICDNIQVHWPLVFANSLHCSTVLFLSLEYTAVLVVTSKPPGRSTTGDPTTIMSDDRRRPLRLLSRVYKDSVGNLGEQLWTIPGLCDLQINFLLHHRPQPKMPCKRCKEFSFTKDSVAEFKQIVAKQSQQIRILKDDLANGEQCRSEKQLL